MAGSANSRAIGGLASWALVFAFVFFGFRSRSGGREMVLFLVFVCFFVGFCRHFVSFCRDFTEPHRSFCRVMIYVWSRHN